MISWTMPDALGGGDGATYGVHRSTMANSQALSRRGPSFTFIAPHSRARGADDRGRRRRDASYGVARDNHPVSTIR
jgi:hypothetical protein